jgi:transposase InsO family protein
MSGPTTLSWIRRMVAGPLKLLVVLDEYSRECLAIEGQQRLPSQRVQDVLGKLFFRYGCPAYFRSDNVPECIAHSLRHWYEHLEVSPLFLEPGSPRENGSGESFNGEHKDELLDGEPFLRTAGSTAVYASRQTDML